MADESGEALNLLPEGPGVVNLNPYKPTTDELLRMEKHNAQHIRLACIAHALTSMAGQVVDDKALVAKADTISHWVLTGKKKGED